jgi:hypothetical protein
VCRAGGGKAPSCPTCFDTGLLPDPSPIRRGDTIPCPACAPRDGLRDALKDVRDALQRALTEAEGPAYLRPGNRVLHAVLSDWSRQASAWLSGRAAP